MQNESKNLCERLTDGTFVRIVGFDHDLESACGTVVGYAGDDPIVKFWCHVSEEYEYSNMVVPRHCISVVADELLPEALGDEEELNAAIKNANMPSEWRSLFCRRIYRTLMKAIQQVADKITPPDTVTVIQTDSYHTDHYPAAYAPVGSHHFELSIKWEGYREGDWTAPESEFKFEVLHYELEWDMEQDIWFEAEHWNGIAHAIISRPDPDSGPGKTEVPALRESRFSEILNTDLDLHKLVSTWHKIQQKVKQEMEEHSKKPQCRYAASNTPPKPHGE